ncbi:MAG: sensor domain-containing phosphodiesterase, partial [Thermodesulfobacteriaceae bacterium]
INREEGMGMVLFRVCPHISEAERLKWQEIVKGLENILREEVDFRLYKSFSEEEAWLVVDDYAPDIYYANPSATVILLRKGYRIIGRYKTEGEKFYLISKKKIKLEEANKIGLIDRLSSYYILHHEKLYYKDLILFETSSDLFKELNKETCEVGIVHENFYHSLDKESKENLFCLKELTVPLYHYFLVSPNFYLKHEERISKLIESLGLINVDEREMKKLAEFKELSDFTKEWVNMSLQLKVLKDIYKLIITVDSEQELFKKLCEILVDKHRFKFVWIGIKEGDWIRPIYKHGEDEGYVEKIRTSTREDLPEGQGPTGRAIREGRIIINENTLTSEFMKPWKDELLKREIYSSIAIPLKKRGEPYGTINIYSTKPYTLRKDYISIFQEIQQDISFALDKIEKNNENIMLKNIIEKSNQLLLIIDNKNMIEYTNEYTVRLTGFSLEELIGQHISFLYQTINKEDLENLIRRKEFSGIFQITSKDKNILFIDQIFTEVLLPDGNCKRIIMGKDISQEILLKEEINKFKYFDLVTESYNLEFFKAKISSIIKDKIYSSFMLIFLDILKMSYLNLTYGYDIGNKILKSIARILKSIFKEGFVSRIGNDEFAVFVPNVEESPTIIYKIRQALEEEIKINEKAFHVSYNASIVFYPRDGETLEELLNNGILTLNLSKREGENVIKFYEKSLNERIKDYLSAELIVKKAFEKKLFRFYFQPYFRAEDLKIAGFESLIRIIDEDGTLYTPGKFIDYLENSRYIKNFERWALETIAEKIKKLNFAVPISINLSAKGILANEENDLISILENLPKEIQNYLVLELTERNIVQDIHKFSTLFKKIKELNENIKIAIDDFGTGYSSLCYLKDLTVDILKIDYYFIKYITRSSKDLALVKILVDLAQKFGLKAIAEGVETTEQVKLLTLLGVDYLQGFYFAKPMPEEEALSLLSASTLVDKTS